MNADRYNLKALALNRLLEQRSVRTGPVLNLSPGFPRRLAHNKTVHKAPTMGLARQRGDDESGVVHVSVTTAGLIEISCQSLRHTDHAALFAPTVPGLIAELTKLAHRLAAGGCDIRGAVTRPGTAFFQSCVARQSYHVSRPVVACSRTD